MPSREVIERAQRRLDEAVEEFFVAMGWNQGITTAWALISHQHILRSDGSDTNSAHNMAFMNGSLPDHVAAGLFLMGMDTVRGVGRFGLARGDEEP